jgi:hypothetical protein
MPVAGHDDLIHDIAPPTNQIRNSKRAFQILKHSIAPAAGPETSRTTPGPDLFPPTQRIVLPSTVSVPGIYSKLAVRLHSSRLALASRQQASQIQRYLIHRLMLLATSSCSALRFKLTRPAFQRLFRPGITASIPPQTHALMGTSRNLWQWRAGSVKF